MKPETKTLKESVPREAIGVPCECRGYTDRVDCTPDEEQKFGCGRTGCCARAFVCRVCKVRIVGSADAPEMD
jgi:hypothetical protein